MDSVSIHQPQRQNKSSLGVVTGSVVTCAGCVLIQAQSYLSSPPSFSACVLNWMKSKTQMGCIYLETDAVAIDSGELCYPHWTLEKITELKRQGHGDVPRKSNMETCSEGRRVEDGGVSSRGRV